MKIKFRDSLGKSLILLKIIRYIMKNARNKKDFIDYVFNIVFNNKNFNIIIIDIILNHFAYEYINNELKRNLFKFTKISIMFNLYKKFCRQKNI